MSALDQDPTLTFDLFDLLCKIDETKSLEIHGLPIEVFKTIIGLKTLNVLFDDTNRPDEPTLQVLLRILKNNPALEKVLISSKEAFKLEVEQPLGSPINLPQLNSLYLSFDRWRDAKYMISHICIPENEGMDVGIHCFTGEIPLENALKSIWDFSSSRIQVKMDFTHLQCIKISGKKGKLLLFPVEIKGMCTALEGRNIFLPCKNIEGLVLTIEADLPRFLAKASLFQVLNTITIKGWENTDEEKPLKEFAHSLNMSQDYSSADRITWRKGL